MRRYQREPTGIGNVVAGVLIAVALLIVIGLGIRWFALDYYRDTMKQRRENEVRMQLEKERDDAFVGPKQPGPPRGVLKK